MIFFTNLDLQTKDRFDMAKMQRFTDSYDPLDSYFLTQLRALPAVGEYIVVKETARPDMLSKTIYGDDSLWWILLYYNNLLSNEDLVTGLAITYPSRTSLETLYFESKTKEMGR